MALEQSKTGTFWVGLACLALLGQTRGAAAQQAAPVRVTTRLVQVHVIAQDKRGELVNGLAREDFVLFDEGREQPISTFAVESNTPSTPCTETLPPNTFSNRLERCLDSLGGASVILFDALDTRLTIKSTPSSRSSSSSSRSTGTTAWLSTPWVRGHLFFRNSPAVLNSCCVPLRTTRGSPAELGYLCGRRWGDWHRSAQYVAGRAEAETLRVRRA